MAGYHPNLTGKVPNDPILLVYSYNTVFMASWYNSSSKAVSRSIASSGLELSPRLANTVAL